MFYIIPTITMLLVITLLVKEYLSNGFTLSFMAQVWFIVIYCLAPMALISSFDNVANHAFSMSVNDVKDIFAQLTILLFYLSLTLGMILGSHYQGFITLTKTTIDIKKLCYFLIAVGLIGLYIFIKSYSGLQYVLSNLSYIRSGHAEIKSYVGAFAFGFFKLVNLSFFICLSQLLITKGKKKPVSLPFLLFNLALCFFGLYLSAGRENAIAFIVSIMVIYISIKKKTPIRFVLTAFIFTVFYIIFGKTLIFAIYEENFDVNEFFSERFLPMLLNSYEIIMVEFAHQYMSLVNFLNYDNNYRYFYDYINWMFVPLKFLGINFGDSISYFNTYIIMDRWESIIPPGPVAFGYMSLGALGVVIHGILIGYTYRMIDKVLNNNNNNNTLPLNPILIGFYAWLVPNFTYLISNSDITLFFQNRIPVILFFLFLVFFCKAKYVKRG